MSKRKLAISFGALDIEYGGERYLEILNRKKGKL